jgi:hypothetical protein
LRINHTPAYDAKHVLRIHSDRRDGRPLSCAVTPYLDGGQPVVTSTLALVGKIGAVLRDERVALLAGGALARGRATVTIEDDGTWFDQVIRAQELRKYPPARFLLRLPGHRRLTAAPHGPLAQLRDLAALSRAATANRPRIDSWKARAR